MIATSQSLKTRREVKEEYKKGEKEKVIKRTSLLSRYKHWDQEATIKINFHPDPLILPKIMDWGEGSEPDYS